MGWRFGVLVLALMTVASLVDVADAGRCAEWSRQLGRQPATPTAPSQEGSGDWRRVSTWKDRHYDLANSLVWSTGTGAAFFGGEPPSKGRWRGGILFDDGVRSGLRTSGRNSRDASDLVSDLILGATMTAPLIVDAIGRSCLDLGHDEETYDILAEIAESYTATLFTAEIIKLATGRERPESQRCRFRNGVDCDTSNDDFKSFISGHAAMSAAGAGLLCANAFRRDLWNGGVAGWATCGLGVGASATVGLLRVAADHHWLTDVLVGWAVGGVIGYFNLPGPADLLRFTIEDASGREVVAGTVTPTVGGGSVGFRIAGRF